MMKAGGRDAVLRAAIVATHPAAAGKCTHGKRLMGETTGRQRETLTLFPLTT